MPHCHRMVYYGTERMNPNRHELTDTYVGADGKKKNVRLPIVKPPDLPGIYFGGIGKDSTISKLFRVGSFDLDNAPERESASWLGPSGARICGAHASELLEEAIAKNPRQGGKLGKHRGRIDSTQYDPDECAICRKLSHPRL
jgi:hypothetical protein